MKTNKTGLKLYNASVKRKEGLHLPKINLFSPLLDVATWNSNWLPSQFASLTELRAYFVADWLRRRLRHQGQTLQLVADPAQANLHLIELDAHPRGGFCLEVAPVLATPPNPLAGTNAPNFSLEVLRYYFMSNGYRLPLQWNAAALASSQAALERLREYATRFQSDLKSAAVDINAPKTEKVPTAGEWRDRFYSSLDDDLNLTRALAVIWTLLPTTLPNTLKFKLLREFDQLLGLRLTSFYEQDSQSQTSNVPLQTVKPKPAPPLKPPTLKPPASNPTQTGRRIISSTREVRSLLNEPDKFDFTVSLIAYHDLTALRQSLDSVLYYSARSQHQVEVIVANLGSNKALTDYLEGQIARYANLRVIYASPERFLGEAAGRNLALRQGRGKYLLLLDAGVVLQGDIFEALYSSLEGSKRAGLYGVYPLQLERSEGKIVGTTPLASKSGQPNILEVEALDGACVCFARKLVEEVGFLDERFRYPFALDLDYSFAFRDKKMAVLALPQLANLVQRPTLAHHRPDYGLPTQDLEHQAQKNWQLFIKSWNL